MIQPGRKVSSAAARGGQRALLWRVRGGFWITFVLQAEDGIRGADVTGVQTCALPIYKALAYLTTIPLDSMKPTERRVFEGDGAEIVYGLIQQAYLDEDYAKVAKVWDVYKTKYEKQVAANPYMNFVAADSFLKLGLTQSFERSVSELSKIKDTPERTFPIWVERIKNIKMNEMLAELELNRYIIEKNWVQASDKLASYPVSLRDSINYPFYRG